MKLNTTVLIVDDDRYLRKLLRMSLENSHRVVHEAATAEEGLRLALHTVPDVLLLDIGLPGLDGFTICRAIDDKPSLWLMKTVIISGHDATEDINQAKRFGINAYLSKPCSLRTVVELVERLEPKRYEMLVVPAEQHD